jgi:hypothetical protein
MNTVRKIGKSWWGGVATVVLAAAVVVAGALAWGGFGAVDAQGGPALVDRPGAVVGLPGGSAVAARTRYVYPVKYVCGTFGHLDEDGRHGGAVKHGNYRTAINITNPHGRTADLRVSVVPAPAHPGVGGVVNAVAVNLRSRQATEFNCPQIERLLGGPQRGFFKGFLYIDSPVELQVVAVYTAQSNERARDPIVGDDGTIIDDPDAHRVTTGMSIDVEYVQPIVTR